MLHQRHPAVAAWLVQQLQSPEPGTVQCVREAALAAENLTSAGFATPTWGQLLEGLRPEQVELELGEFVRGWQRLACHFPDEVALSALQAELDDASRALLLSQAGTYGGRVFTVIPTAVELQVSSAHMRVLLLRRLRMPLVPTPNRCRCGRFLDPFGDHRAACSRSGVLGLRGAPLEGAAARMCREAGARVATNVFLRDMNLDVPVLDGRRIEVVANGLPIWHGAQLAVDTTLVSPIRGDGRPHRRAASEPGVVLGRADWRKRRSIYPELLQARRSRLLVLGFEVGGRWSGAALDFLRRLARTRARGVPSVLQASARQAFAYRWSGLLSVAAQNAFAASLLEVPLQSVFGVDGPVPDLGDTLADARWQEAPVVSRLPGGD